MQYDSKDIENNFRLDPDLEFCAFPLYKALNDSGSGHEHMCGKLKYYLNS